MAVETFRRAEPRKLDPKVEQALITRYETLGFRAVVKDIMDDPQLRAIQEVFPEMTPEVAKVWREFLAYTYLEEGDGGRDTMVENWSRMRTPPPAEVLEEISFAKQHFAFDSLEIWSKEKVDKPIPREDPLVVGRKNGHLFMLARWGESLQPFAEIARFVREARVEYMETWARASRESRLVCATAGGFAVLLTALLLALLQTADGFFGLFGFLAAAVPLGIWVMQRRERAQKAFETRMEQSDNAPLAAKVRQEYWDSRPRGY